MADGQLLTVLFLDGRQKATQQSYDLLFEKQLSLPLVFVLSPSSAREEECRNLRNEGAGKKGMVEGGAGKKVSLPASVTPMHIEHPTHISSHPCSSLSNLEALNHAGWFKLS